MTWLNTNEDMVEYVVPLLLFVILILLVIVFVLAGRIKSKDKELDGLSKQLENELSYPEFLQKSLEEPDIFVELDRLNYLKGKDLSPTLAYFFEELAGRAGLEKIGKYKERVSFMPRLYRSREKIGRGDTVEIIIPGWKYKERVIRYPLVQKTSEGD